MVRSKGRERRAVREGDVLEGSALVAVHGGGGWRRLAIIIHLCCRPLLLLLLLFVAVIWSCPLRTLKFFSIAGGRWWWEDCPPLILAGIWQNLGNSWNSDGINFGPGAHQTDQTILTEF